MSATAQPEGKDAPGKVPEGKTPEPKTDDKMVPLGEFIELRQQLKAMGEKLKTFEDQRVAPEKVETKTAPPVLTDTEQLRNELKDIQRRERLRDLTNELGLGDQKQAQAVLDILGKNPDLAPPEALELAAKRAPDTFKERGGSGFDPNIHGSLRPKPGNQPPEPKPSEHKQRIAHMAKLTKEGRRHDAEEFAVDLIGQAGAKALGWDYKPKPIQ